MDTHRKIVEKIVDIHHPFRKSEKMWTPIIFAHSMSMLRWQKQDIEIEERNVAIGETDWQIRAVGQSTERGNPSGA